MPEVPFSTALAADGHVLKVSGVLDELSVEDFRTALHQAIGTSRGMLTVDLSGVYFLPSLALGVLVSIMNTGTSIRLVARRGCAADRVLQMTGLPYSQDHPSTGSAVRSPTASGATVSGDGPGS